MTVVPTTTSYAGRQVDLELLQSVTTPKGEQRVYLTSVGDKPKIVSGVQKLIQRYAVLLLTTLNDIRFDPKQGGILVSSLAAGRIQNTGYLYHIFGMANMNTLRILSDDDSDTRFGVPPADERLTDAELIDTALDYTTGTISMTVALTTAAGTSFTFVVPVGTMME